MNLKKLFSFLELISLFNFAYAEVDWAQFDKYHQANLDFKKTEKTGNPIMVFMGNSITEGWMNADPGFFDDNNFIGRGISGQTTYQMLLRFREDVINIKPDYVLINGGINDIAENNHHYNEERTFGNIVSMVELAKSNGIIPVLSSVLPGKEIYWRKSIEDVPQKIISLNKKIKQFADANGLIFINYYTAMGDEEGGLNRKFTKDGIHPNLEGYKIMEETLLKDMKK